MGTAETGVGADDFEGDQLRRRDLWFDGVTAIAAAMCADKEGKPCRACVANTNAILAQVFGVTP